MFETPHQGADSGTASLIRQWREAMRPVPPAYSPLPLRALAAGTRAAVFGGGRVRERMATRLADHFGARRVLFTDSGTSALVVALEAAAARREDGGSVALPAFGCFDLATAVEGAGVEPVLYDVDPRSLAPDLASLRRSLEAGAGSVVVAHLYGVPADLDAVGRLAGEAGALLLEDAAQGVGASFGGRPLGSHGSLSVLSFGRGKGFTGGGGGALLAHDESGVDVLDRASGERESAGRGVGQLMSAFAQWALGRPGWYAIPASLPGLQLGETVYHSPSRPRDAPSACLAVLEESWDASLDETSRRRQRAQRLLEDVRRAEDLEGIQVPVRGTPGYLRLPVLAVRESAKQRLSGRAARRSGIMPSYPKPLARLEGFMAAMEEGRRGGREAFPGAEMLAERLFTLPVHSHMTDADRSRVSRILVPGPDAD